MSTSETTNHNINFRTLSLNARGIRTLEQRKALFHWLKKEKADVIFLQETYSTVDVENTWKSQWKGDLFFAHGSKHSKGVLILVKENLNFELLSCKLDSQGRFIILKANVQDHPFYLVNIYTPNKTKEQCAFFQEIQNELEKLDTELAGNTIIGGDFNVILNPEVDGFIAQGQIIRSRANWYEFGEKSNKYFLNLESSRKKKSCIQKLKLGNDSYTSDPKEILNEIQSFYTNLYDTKGDYLYENSIDSFLGKVNIYTLTNEQRDSLERELTVNECLATLKRIKHQGMTDLWLNFISLSGQSLENVFLIA